MEKWKIVVGFDTYTVSDLGRVRNIKTGKLLKPRCDRYPHVALNRVERTVHILVLEAFVGPRPEGMLGLHGDDDPLNNKLVNLRWGTHEDNQVDRKKTLIGSYYPGRPPKLGQGDYDRVRDLVAAGIGATAIERWLGITNVPRKLMRGETHRY